jgi:hypothetical protein
MGELAERAARAKRPRWRELSRPRHEVWSSSLSQLTTGAGFAIRYALVEPGCGAARAEVEFTSTVPDQESANLAVIQEYPLDQHHLGEDPLVVRVGPCALEAGRMTGMLDAAGTPVTWDLVHETVTEPLEPLPEVFYRTSWVRSKLLVPHPFLQVGGKIEIGGRSFILNGDPGVQTHLWGSRHPAEWAWFHASAFVEPGGEPISGYVTGLVARPAAGPLLLPPVAFGHLVWREHHVALAPENPWRDRGSGRWRWTGRRGDEEVTATASFAWSDMVLGEHVEGRARVFRHRTTRADCRLEFRAPRRPPAVVQSTGSTHLEIGSRRADPRAARRALRQRKLVGAGLGGVIPQPLHRTPRDQVLAEDRVRVLDGHRRVPDVLGIDRDHRTVAALVEAAGVVDPDRDAEARLLHQLLQARVHRPGVDGSRGAARPAGADEHVLLERTHGRAV